MLCEDDTAFLRLFPVEETMDPFMSNFNVALRPHLNPRPKLSDLHIKVHKQVSTVDVHPMSNRSQLYVKLMITFLPYHIIRNITQ